MKIKKIKIFNCCGSAMSMQNDINKFIEKRDVVGVYQSESLSAGDYSLTITILYEVN